MCNRINEGYESLQLFTCFFFVFGKLGLVYAIDIKRPVGIKYVLKDQLNLQLTMFRTVQELKRYIK